MASKHDGASAPGARANQAKLFDETPVKEDLLAPADNETKELINLALQVKELAPWQWMGETDVFGVEDPETGNLGFISIMGTLREYVAIAVYLGAKGVYGWMDFEDALELDPESESARDLLMEIPQLQVSFTEREFFEKRDKNLLKAAGRKLTGNDPLLRSYRPGHLPWFVTRAEARFLIHVLSQTLEVARSFDQDSDIFPSIVGGDNNRFLVRVPRKDDTSLVWEDQIQSILRPTPVPIEATVDMKILDELKGISQSDSNLEVDMFSLPGAIGEPGERPRQLYTLMIADSDAGIIYGCDAVSADDGFELMYATVPDRVLRLLLDAKMVPKQIKVRSERWLKLLEPLRRDLNVNVEQSASLPAIEGAAEFLLEQMEM